MSYILDALRKSDQMRQRGATPTLASVPPPAAVSARTRRLRNAALAVVLIGVGVLLGWLQPWVSRPPGASPEPAAVERAAEDSRRAVGSGLGSSDLAGELPASVAGQPSVPGAAADEAGEEALPAVAAVAPPAAPPASAVSGEAPALADLPPSVRSEIPPISIAFHAYSGNPGERRVMINGAMAGEGDQLAGGLVLERITRDGVILAYRGTRFHHPVR